MSHIRMVNNTTDLVELRLLVGNNVYSMCKLGPYETLELLDAPLLNYEKVAFEYRPEGLPIFQWMPITGTQILATLIVEDHNGKLIKVPLGGPNPSEWSVDTQRDSLNITNIEYNAEFDDYDITCTTCGMCFIAQDESKAQNILFGHLKSDHNYANSK